VDLKTTYRPTDPKKALFLHKNRGPAFGGNSLSLDFCKMNSKNNGRCYTNGEGGCNYYKIGTDAEGNNIVTGEGKEQKNYQKSYTCVNLEVYKIIY
jgi:hypothetical protein